VEGDVLLHNDPYGGRLHTPEPIAPSGRSLLPRQGPRERRDRSRHPGPDPLLPPLIIAALQADARIDRFARCPELATAWSKPACLPDDATLVEAAAPMQPGAMALGEPDRL
jgi:hypothetical protein